MTKEQVDRVSYLVGHHHTLHNIEGIDYRILIEADYIANASENGYDTKTILKFRETTDNATCKIDAKLTYKSNNKNITVSSKGKITIKKNYIGKATITITAAKTNTYKKATKTITVTVKHIMVNGVQ